MVGLTRTLSHYDFSINLCIFDFVKFNLSTFYLSKTSHIVVANPISVSNQFCTMLKDLLFEKHLVIKRLTWFCKYIGYISYFNKFMIPRFVYFLCLIFALHQVQSLSRIYVITRNVFLRKNVVAVLFFRTGQHTFPFFQYKTSILSKITEDKSDVSDEFSC